LSFLDDCATRGDDEALANRRGLRVNRWAYTRLRSAAFQFARELESRGIEKGDRVLFWSENNAEWVAAFFGCLLRGAIIVPLDSRSPIAFARRVHQQVNAKLLLAGTEQSIALDPALPRIDLDELSDMLAPLSDAPYPAQGIGAEDLVEIIFTSGTTAEPKGVCLTHRNLLANLAPLEREIKKYIRWERPFHPIRFLNLVPLSHVFGQFMGIFVPQLLGGVAFFQRSLNPSEIIQTVKRERISVIVAVPRQLETLRDHIERDYETRGERESFRHKLEAADGIHFLKRWWVFRRVHHRFGWKFWTFVSGGATLSAETETFWRRLGYAVVQGYGMTETASIISVNHPFRLSRGSIGKTMPGQEVKLDESGEILVRGDNVSAGYWSEGVKRVAGDDGWLRTGDIGERDPQGNLFFRGRKKDVIVTAAGLNIYPEDIEAALNGQPEVRESCVVGIEGPRGPEPLAALILNEGDADAAEAVRRANLSLGEYQQVRRWFIWPDADFPRTSTTQKVLKRAVAEAVSRVIPGNEEGSSRNEKIRTGRSSSSVLQTLAQISGQSADELGPSASLAEDLKLDSLGRVELISALEDRYQIEIDEAAFTSATTVTDIERMITQGARDLPIPNPYPGWARRFPVTWIRLLVFYFVILPIARLMGRARVQGRERLRALSGPVLFVSNHISMVDHGLILSSLPAKYRRNLAIAMEGERLRGWRYPPSGTGGFARLRLLTQYGLVVALFNVFPLPQKSGFRRSFAYAGESVDSGYSVLVFPEGRTTTDGEMRPFMRGIGILTSDLNLPVVPVKIEGLFRLKKERRYFARAGEVSVSFGEPVVFDKDRDPASIAAELESIVANL
ncbi:MAG TPA: AMP-binding protein, partial [Blastocatellia bacterium]|nr:AMP-binding protein [Blastocatellia bacterium]